MIHLLQLNISDFFSNVNKERVKNRENFRKCKTTALLSDLSGSGGVNNYQKERVQRL